MVADTARAWLPRWSEVAALRAVRTTLVVVGLFAFCSQVIGNAQVATFAAFGGFATLLLSAFGGDRREKLRAHLGLALAGSVLLTLGSAVAHTVLLAGLVTLPVVFIVLFAGLAGPNAASGATGALLLYVLPAASPGSLGMVPDRLAGWWMASLAGTASVLLLSPRAREDGLRASASELAEVLALCIDAALRGELAPAALDAAAEASDELATSFTASPLRPVGWGDRDQALADTVELLEWSSALVGDALTEISDLRAAAEHDRSVLAASASALRAIAGTLAGEEPGAELVDLSRLLAGGRGPIARISRSAPEDRASAHSAYHAQMIGLAVLAAGSRAAASRPPARRRAGLAAAAGTAPTAVPAPARSHGRGVARAAAANASVRSVWLVNSLRGAAAIAVAVAVANATDVQHGFWVVLGTLSVLRTNASATGASALRALLGTVIGFAVGGALLVTIGGNETALWVVLPFAVFAAGYTPGFAPFAAGQAAFTITVAVLFNLLEPVGWKVGVVRIEDVAVGCAVSLVIGGLLWPRGVAAVVGDDLADSYRSSAAFLADAIRWVSDSRRLAPERALQVERAAIRLGEALRAFITERGTKHVGRSELWRLVGGSVRLRLTAQAVADLPPAIAGGDRARAALEARAHAIVSWYEQLAMLLDKPRNGALPRLQAPVLGPETVVESSFGSTYSVWLCEHLDHLAQHLMELVPPATQIARARRRPWWR
jgi:hypothetical protein